MESSVSDPIATLPVPDPKAPSTPRTATIKTPQEITYFSFDKTHTYCPDASGLRWYYNPLIGACLSDGFKTFEKLDDSRDEHLDALLRSLMELEQRSGARVETDFVTWRGMFTKVMTAPYNNDEFTMNATCFQGTIFIEEDKAAKLKLEAQKTYPAGTYRGMPSSEVSSYWGYKFETLATISAPWAEVSREEIEARPATTVNNAAQFCSVVSSRVGPHAFVIGGEVDAVWDVKRPPAPFPAPSDPNAPPAKRTTYVELKTAVLPQTAPAHARFEGKWLRFWAQSFLLGVPRIVVGWRSRGAAPTLDAVSVYTTTRIPRMVREDGNASWDSGVCLAFLDAFLAHLKRVLGGRDGVFRVQCVRVAGAGAVRVQRIADGVSEVVSREFVAWRTTAPQQQAGST